MTLGFHRDTISGDANGGAKFHIWQDPKEMQRRGKSSNTTFETFENIGNRSVVDSIHQILRSTALSVPSFHTPSCRPPATQPIGNLGTAWHCLALLGTAWHCLTSHKMSRDVTSLSHIQHIFEIYETCNTCNLHFNKFLTHLGLG